MKKALKITSTAILSLSMFMFVSTFTSCSTEGCTDETAINYDEKADEDDGSCEYQRDAMIGNYTTSGSVTCGVSGSGTTSALPIAITASTASTSKIVVDFDGISLTATVSGSTFTIDNQSLSGFTYTGNGTISGNVLNVTINEFDASIPETCVFTLNGTRQ